MAQTSNLLFALFTFIGCFILLAARPVPATAVLNPKIITGKIVNVQEAESSGKILLRLKNDDRTYYLNRGTENKVDFKLLKNNLLYRSAMINLTENGIFENSVAKEISVSRVTVAGQVFWQQPNARFVVN